jgi:uncharacterized protein
MSSLAPIAPAARTSAEMAESARHARRSPRATFIKWLRQIHGWVGLWGAALGLLFGTTGFLLNHRGGMLHVSTGAPQVSTIQVPLPSPPPGNPRELAHWLRHDFGITGRPGRVQQEPEHPVAWGQHETKQPEHWSLMFSAPSEMVTADYWVGDSFVTLKRSDNRFLATLTNLHKGVGLGIGWVLLVDTLAGSIILLSLSGVLLWALLHRRRAIAVVLVLGSISLAAWAALA